MVVTGIAVTSVEMLVQLMLALEGLEEPSVAETKSVPDPFERFRLMVITAGTREKDIFGSSYQPVRRGLQFAAHFQMKNSCTATVPIIAPMGRSVCA
jgi:hypothetical protein